MAFRLLELGGRALQFIHTSTRDELPEFRRHLLRIEDALASFPVRRGDGVLRRAGATLIRIGDGRSLCGLVDSLGTLPGVGASRWCCHVLKRRPTIVWLRELGLPVEMCVGFRCDEPKRRGYRWPEDLDVKVRFPLREWSWCKDRVRAYLDTLDLWPFPSQTNCARCPQQRLGDWWRLWKKHPGIWRSAEAQERKWGGTFRHPERDTWPASLRDLRAEFEAGRLPRGVEPVVDGAPPTAPPLGASVPVGGE